MSSGDVNALDCFMINHVLLLRCKHDGTSNVCPHNQKCLLSAYIFSCKICNPLQLSCKPTFALRVASGSGHASHDHERLCSIPIKLALCEGALILIRNTLY